MVATGAEQPARPPRPPSRARAARLSRAVRGRVVATDASHGIGRRTAAAGRRGRGGGRPGPVGAPAALHDRRSHLSGGPG
ncbi:hypothetical protein GCM10009660_45930 [Catellatospora bangladeshensis]